MTKPAAEFFYQLQAVVESVFSKTLGFCNKTAAKQTVTESVISVFQTVLKVCFV